MPKQKPTSILKEAWDILDEYLTDMHHIRVGDEELYAVAGLGNLLFTPEEIDAARKRFREWPDHTVVYPLWTLDKEEIRESAARLGIQIEENDFGEVIKNMRTRIADTFGDAWDEMLDQEVEFAVNNRIAEKMEVQR